MTTVYISIGTPKTGTTALQNFMYRNDKEMRKQGYCYPHLRVGISNLYKERNGHFLIYESHQENKSEHEEQVKERGFEQLAEVVKECPNIVLSDEQIWYRCRRKPDFWKEIIERFRSINCEVKVIVYLRRQDQLLQSLWNQSIKMFRKGTLTFQECLEKDYFRYVPLDYYENLKYIEKDLGKENVIVRPYERGRFEGEEHSLFSDFFQSVGLTLTDGFERPEKTKNLGLEGNYIEIKRLINGVPEYREMRDFLCRPVLNGSIYQSENGGQGKTSMFTYEDQVAYQAQFDESNRKVAEEYLGRKPGEPLFYDEIREMPLWSFNEENMYRDIITCMTEAFCAQEKKIAELSTETRELRKELQSGFFYRLKRKLRKIFKKKN